VSDGTETGTVEVKDIHPNHSSDPQLLTVHAGRLWFFADDGEHGRELWSSDGTAAGTALAAEFASGSDSFHPAAMISLGDRLVISGFSPVQGSGLWVTDGTAAGTRKIHEKGLSGPFAWTVFQGRLYYTAANEDTLPILWMTDGTAAGTGPFLDHNGMKIYRPARFAVLGDRLLFKTRDFGVPLWESDGTSAGTFLLLPQTVPGTNAPEELIRAGNRVFFPSVDHSHGVELWAVGAD
jgi:ELWxxDGT repeat protein